MKEPVILKGAPVAEKIYAEITATLERAKSAPTLSIVQIGHDPASSLYVTMKRDKAKTLGINASIIQLDENVTRVEVEQELQSIVAAKTDGVMIQLPLPSHLKAEEILALIPKHLDIDGLTENSPYPPAVVSAVIAMIQFYALQNMVKTVTIAGQGTYVGKPMKKYIEQQFDHFTIQTIDEWTNNPEEMLQHSDLVISCIGRPHIYDETVLKKGAYLIDVGTSRDPQTGKIVGDFSLSQQGQSLSGYTPVPGGIGPVTVASLMKQVVVSAIQNY